MYNDEFYEEIINTYTYDELRKYVQEENERVNPDWHYGPDPTSFEHYVLSVSELKAGQSVEINLTTYKYTIL